ncbi:MAG: hypothetical protein ACE5LD_03010, partial [Candidatus Bipolaricaulia bacterium]
MEEWRDDEMKQPPKGGKGRIMLVVGGAIALYLAGFLTHFFLFASPVEDPVTAQDRAAAIEDGPAQRPPEGATEGSSSPQLESLPIEEAYRRIVEELSALAEKDGQDPELKASISRLTDGVTKLRTLNPYYRFKEIKGEVIPKGVPELYGEELGV